MEVNVHFAKTNLSRLILKVEGGEKVVIARNGKPAVRLVPVHARARKLFKPGALKGRLKVPASFLDPDPELEALFYHSPLVTNEAARRGEVARGDGAAGRTPRGRKTGKTGKS